MPDDFFEKYTQYEEKFPLLQELCELSLDEVKDQVGYISALYGMALGYLSNRHPSGAYAELALACSLGLHEISEPAWKEIQLRIANKLEERAINDDAV